MVVLLLIDNTKLEIISDKIFLKILRYKPNILPPMIKNTYSSNPNPTTNLLPNPSVLLFLKQYSQSVEALKGKKGSYLLAKN